MPDDESVPQPPDAQQPGLGARDEGQRIALTLAGRLPCIGCRYDLQGLSVLGNCPECGLAVRATVLYAVDPDAEALRPLRHPRVVAMAAPVWATAGLLAALCAWLPRLDDIVRHQTGGRADLPVDWAPTGVLVFVALSGLAALALVRPLAGVHRRWSIAAGVAVALYIPLLVVLHRVAFVIDPVLGDPYLTRDVDAQRLGMRIAMGALVVGILLGLRPNARLLVARCLALRTGRVDRQTIYATVASVALAMFGDALRLTATMLPESQRWAPELGGVLLVVAGSLLFTVAMAGATIDSWRISRSIRTPSPSLRQVLGER